MISNSDLETIEIAKKFASILNGGEIICLHGNLGAGKTTFMKGVAEFFEINKDEIISPTFIIANILNIKNKNIKNIIHIDAYRIDNEDNILEFGILEYFNEKDSIVFVEWSEKIKSYIKEQNKIDIYFNILDNNKRNIEIK